MSEPAQSLSTENPMIDRVAVAVLERDVVHLDKTLSEVKADMKIGFHEVHRKFDDKFEDLKDSLASAKIWALVLYIGMGIGLLTLIGKAFHWI